MLLWKRHMRLSIWRKPHCTATNSQWATSPTHCIQHIHKKHTHISFRKWMNILYGHRDVYHFRIADVKRMYQQHSEWLFHDRLCWPFCIHTLTESSALSSERLTPALVRASSSRANERACERVGKWGWSRVPAPLYSRCNAMECIVSALRMTKFLVWKFCEIQQSISMWNVTCFEY